ncbi:MAG: hypothetical protein PHY48_17350 [Candidatus Cloacimonetes bacterium]|nr:hypothetical protein [Candidatus Cloacimonadota bacterium]
MACINAVHIHIGDKNVPGPVYVFLQLNDYSTDCNGEILLTANLATVNEVDSAVEHLIEEIQEAGRAAKRILSKSHKYGSIPQPLFGG